MHTGTHIDSPTHMLASGKELTDFSLERFIAPGILVDVRGEKEIDETSIENIEKIKNKIVLFFSGHDKSFCNSNYYQDHPVITESFAEKIAHAKPSMIGIDFPSPDKHPFNVHKILFDKEILIIENLTNLEKLLNLSEFEVIALPIKIEAGGAVARVIARHK